MVNQQPHDNHLSNTEDLGVIQKEEEGKRKEEKESECEYEEW